MKKRTLLSEILAQLSLSVYKQFCEFQKLEVLGCLELRKKVVTTCPAAEENKPNKATRYEIIKLYAGEILYALFRLAWIKAH